MRLGQHIGNRRGGAHPADFPSGERKDLARRPDLDRALAHPRFGHQRNMRVAVEGQMLPHLVADRDGIVRDAEIGEQLAFGGIEHRARRIEW